MNSLKCWLAICLFCVFGSRLSMRAAFAEHFNAAQLSMANGLPSNYVDDIYEDRLGFIWIATHGGGLVRYDGYTYLYLGIGHSTLHLRSNYCRNMTEDRFHRLWVAFDEYTDVLDLHTMQPVRPRGSTPAVDHKLQSLLAERGIRVQADPTGLMWVATRGHIYALAFNDTGEVETISLLAYSSYHPDVSLCHLKGVGMLSSHGGQVHRLAPSPGGPGVKAMIEKPLPEGYDYPRGTFITSMLPQRGRLWLGTNLGLYATGKGLQAYRHTADPSSLVHDFISSLAVAPDGRLLVGTLAGVDVMDNGRFEHWNSSSTVNPLASNFVNCMLSARGLVWVGTESGGITRLSTRQLHLRNYMHSSHPGSLSPNAVNAIWAEPGGTLWVGTVEGGLNRMAPGTETFTHYTTANSPLPHNSVSAFAADSAGQLWIGTWGGGVSSMPTSKPGNITPLGVPQAYTAALNFVGALAYDRYNHMLWIGTNDGIYSYDLKTRSLFDPFPGNRSIHGCVGSLIDRKGTLWMGCLDGVVRINLRSRNGKHFAHRQMRYKLDAPGSGIIDKITCFCQSADGTVWLGSSGYGLYRRERDSRGNETFKAYTVADGMVGNNVRGLAEGRDGSIWIATEQGLSQLNPRTGVFANYGVEDGLASAQFYFNGAAMSPGGQLLLGSAAGLTVVSGVDTGQHHPGHLRFTKLTIDGQMALCGSRFLDDDISQASRIRMHESDRSFTIEFSSLTYRGSRQGRYSYRMKGFDDRWMTLQPGEHAVRYTALPAGSYEFQVKYEPALGRAAVQQASIEIVVKPYFWKSWWFVCIVLMLVAAAAVVAYRRRMEQTKRAERERILQPIAQALAESDTPELLRKHIEAIVDNQRKYVESREKVVEADREEQQKSRKTFVEQLIEAMEANYANADFGVAELSEAMAISKPILSKQVNTELGMPTSQFIRNYRLDIARKMIEDNVANRNITEIAYRVGFNDPKYFTRCFTKRYGVSPSAYKGEK